MERQNSFRWLMSQLGQNPNLPRRNITAVRLDIVGQSSKPSSPTAMPFTPTRPPPQNTAEKQRVRQQMLACNWHDDAISSELGSFCQKSHLIAGFVSGGGATVVGLTDFGESAAAGSASEK